MFIGNEKINNLNAEDGENIPEPFGSPEISPIRPIKIPEIYQNRIKALKKVIRQRGAEVPGVVVIPTETEKTAEATIEPALKVEMSAAELDSLDYERAMKELLGLEAARPETAEEAELKEAGEKVLVVNAIAKSYLDILSSLN